MAEGLNHEGRHRFRVLQLDKYMFNILVLKLNVVDLGLSQELITVGATRITSWNTYVYGWHRKLVCRHIFGMKYVRYPTSKHPFFNLPLDIS